MQLQPPPLPALLPPGAAEVRADALPPPALPPRGRRPLCHPCHPCHPPVSCPRIRGSISPRTPLSPPPLPALRCCHRGHRDTCMWEYGRGSSQCPHSFCEIPWHPWQPLQRDAGLLIHPVPSPHPWTHPPMWDGRTLLSTPGISSRSKPHGTPSTRQLRRPSAGASQSKWVHTVILHHDTAG